MLLALIPIGACFFLFAIYPILYGFYISLFDWSLVSPRKPFVGLENYADVVTDPLFWTSLRNTFYFTLATVGVGTFFCLAMALLVKSFKQPWNIILMTLIFAPVVASQSPTSLLFSWMYQPTFGVLNYLLKYVGLGPYQWITSSSQALASVWLMTQWKNVGYGMIIFLAGLNTIPTEFYEAAAIDGATGWLKFRYITFPLLKPITLFVVVTGTIFAVQIFTPIFIMTGGGPGTSTLVMVQHIYDVGFKFFSMGRASTLAMLLFVALFFVTLIQFKSFRENFEY